MRTVVSLSVYLESYSITREQFMAEVNKDREFYNKYIDWKNKDSATIISPKALERLGEVFNDKSDKKSDKKPEQIKMEEVMNAPAAELETEKTQNIELPSEAPVTPKKRQRKASTEEKPSRKKKSKNSITKQFISEHGQLTPEMMQDTKELRMFLMGSGYKAEQVALMGDEEVKNAVSKDYFFIKSTEGLYVIRRSALTSIAGDVSFVAKEEGK